MKSGTLPDAPSYVPDAGQLRDLRHELVPIQGEPPAGGQAYPRGRRQLSGERRQMLGIRSEEVHHGPSRLIRRQRAAVDGCPHVHTRMARLSAPYVDFTGKYVERDEHLLSIYSPELVATQQEYLLAYNAQQQMRASGIPSVAQGSLDLLEAARQRLLLWDIRSEDIEALERAGKVSRTVDLHSEVAGYVVQKMAFHGMRITPADTLYDIADLSQVWVLADVYESDLPLVRAGMQGELTAPYIPGRSWRGPVTYVSRQWTRRRTVKFRIGSTTAVCSQPDMFVDVGLRAELGTGLSIRRARSSTAAAASCLLDRGDGRFRPAVGLESGRRLPGARARGRRARRTSTTC